MELVTEALSSMSTSAPTVPVATFFISASFSFWSLEAFAFAAVDRTAVAAFACSSFFGGCIGSGYAKSDGRAPQFNEKFFGIFSLSFKPTRAVGVRVSENMWIRGYQYHICAKRQKPMAAPLRSIPECEKNEAQQFLPPASMMPLA